MGTKQDVAKLVSMGKGAVAFNPNPPKPSRVQVKPVLGTVQQKAAKALAGKGATPVKPVASVKPGTVKAVSRISGIANGDDEPNQIGDAFENIYGGGGATPLTNAVATPTFNPNGNLAWGGAQGLSQDAVDWLSRGADSAYFDDVNTAQRTYDGFTSDLQTQREQNASSRMKALARLGYDQTTKRWNDQDMTTSRGQAINDMGYDFGARGLLHSSEYARQLANTNQQFQDQADAIVTGGDQYNAAADAQRANAQGDLADTKLAAIRNAVQRRAATAGALI